MTRTRILLQRLALTAGLLLGALGSVHAQEPRSPKVSADLRSVLAAPAVTPVPWARKLSGQWHVKVLINASSTGPELAALRADILVRGGSIFYNFLSVR